MQIGLLWFDNSSDRELTAKIEAAARRYREKFGVPPDTCYVNTMALQGQDLTIPLPQAQGGTLHVRPASNVLLHHFWVGVEEPA